MDSLLLQKKTITGNSFLKCLDSLYDLMEKNELNYEKKSKGDIRIILYLEDLGPIEQYKQSETEINKEILKQGFNGLNL